MSDVPSVCRLVHYVSYGTPGGEYPPTCRAAVITEVGAWVTVSVTDEVDGGEFTRDGAPGQVATRARTAVQWWYEDAVALTVFNPTGLFFNGAGPVACLYQPRTDPAAPLVGGTWHWPERVPAAA